MSTTESFNKLTMEGLLTSMDPSDPQFYTHLKAAADGDISYGTPSCTSEQVGSQTILLFPGSVQTCALFGLAPRGQGPPRSLYARLCAISFGLIVDMSFFWARERS